MCSGRKICTKPHQHRPPHQNVRLVQFARAGIARVAVEGSSPAGYMSLIAIPPSKQNASAEHIRDRPVASTGSARNETAKTDFDGRFRVTPTTTPCSVNRQIDGLSVPMTGSCNPCLRHNTQRRALDNPGRTLTAHPATDPHPPQPARILLCMYVHAAHRHQAIPGVRPTHTASLQQVCHRAQPQRRSQQPAISTF